MIAKSAKKISEFIRLATDISTNDLAAVLGLDPSVVSRLYAARTIHQNGKRGKYDATKAVPEYLASIRTTGTAEIKARLAVQQERKLRIQNDKEDGRLIKIEDAAEALRTYCLHWRAGANALPRRLANQLSDESSPQAIHRIMTDEFHGLFYEMEKVLREFFTSQGEDFSVIETGARSTSNAPKKKMPRTRKSVKSKKVINRRRKVVTNERKN